MAKSKTQDLTIRKAPKYLTFIVLGTVLGIITGFVLNAVSAQSAGAPLLGVLVVYCAGLGLGLGVIVALVIDRVFRAKAKVVKAEVSR
jgi:cation transporter-like permease